MPRANGLGARARRARIREAPIVTAACDRWHDLDRFCAFALGCSMSSFLDRLSAIRVVLVAPSHPGNIGSAARAMYTMGLDRLVLVNPRHFPHPEAVALASGATPVLD